MAEAGPTVSPNLQAELDRIEAAVRAGNLDLGALGFWRLVARVKLDRTLVERHAEQIGRIDAAAFRASVRLRAPVWLGNAVLVAGVGVGLAAAILARSVSSRPLSGALLVVAGAAWAVCLHSPTHWAVGRAIGLRFTDYFLGGRPPFPGLKMDYATYLPADPAARAWMHASGAIATKLAPFLALAFWPGSDAPAWAAVALAALGAFQIATDAAFSVRSSDWKRFRRERAVARALRGK